ncbi:MAG: [ribosomal protein S5]-alanine N-acetyltransferase [Thermoleophilaceae bacterium]|jgi:RimJ/RimL family protein N-acetyltransferase|nr:[ribosomal protein S5]-alanine N-acetyltransferase [Thermoleophilaceae bacterium]
MTIEGDGFVLRPERPGDAAAMAQAFTDDPHLAVDWGIEDAPNEQTAHEWTTGHAKLWDNGEGRHFAVADPETDVMIGGVNFHGVRSDHRRAEVGFWLAPAARGRGIGSGAVAAACRWAFGRWDLVRIEMTTLPGNEGSLALARKIGFEREGLLRRRNLERGNQVDIVMLGLLRDDLAAPVSPATN